MAPTKSTKGKKEKVFHPQSRKAGQMERTQLRKSKLSEAAQKKSKLASSTIDKYVFFFHAIPDDKDALGLEELHAIIKNVWLTRLDSQLEEERQSRRKGRPKTTKEVKLETLKEVELEEYRTGMEVIDLTHPANVKLFRNWDQSALEYIDLLRFVRISSSNPTSVIVSKPGKHLSLKEPTSHSQTEESAMQED